MCLTFQILSPEIQRGLFIKSMSQTPSYMKFRKQFLLLCINLSLMLYPWKNLLLTQTLPFTDKKGCLRQTVSYTHTPTHILTYVYIYTHRERDIFWLLWEPLYKVWNINCISSKGKSLLLLISSFLLPSNCLCPFIPQADCNSCQGSQAETDMTPTSCSCQKEACNSCISIAAPQPILCFIASWTVVWEGKGRGRELNWTELMLEIMSYNSTSLKSFFFFFFLSSFLATLTNCQYTYIHAKPPSEREKLARVKVWLPKIRLWCP